MAKDPAFLFYPGDYLKDTQCLSEKVQVAYDRIMCEHMRNICISPAQLKFFTKRLNQEELEELKMVLTKVDGGYQIDWVVESINKRKAYSESRSKNRNSKKTKDKSNISNSYVSHMENENENENEIDSGNRKMNDMSKSNLFRKPNIPIFEDVHRIFVQQGGTEEMAKKFYSGHESTGWFFKGSPITNFASMIPGFISSWKGYSKNNNRNKSEDKANISVPEINYDDTKLRMPLNRTQTP